MAKQYKVWIEVEEYDDETESGETLGCLDIGCSGSFDTEEEAHAFAKELHSYRHESGTA